MLRKRTAQSFCAGGRHGRALKRKSFLLRLRLIMEKNTACIKRWIWRLDMAAAVWPAKGVMPPAQAGICGG